MTTVDLLHHPLRNDRRSVPVGGCSAVFQRWRTPFTVALAGAAGLVAGRAVSGRGLAIVAGVVLAGALVAWVVVLPGRLAPPVSKEELTRITDPKARLRLRHDLRNGALQTLAVVAVLAGAVLGFRQLNLGFEQLNLSSQQLAEDRANAVADRELTRQGQASDNTADLRVLDWWCARPEVTGCHEQASGGRPLGSGCRIGSRSGC
jgi:hypothetical protein